MRVSDERERKYIVLAALFQTDVYNIYELWHKIICLDGTK